MDTFKNIFTAIVTHIVDVSFLDQVVDVQATTVPVHAQVERLEATAIDKTISLASRIVVLLANRNHISCASRIPSEHVQEIVVHYGVVLEQSTRDRIVQAEALSHVVLTCLEFGVDTSQVLRRSKDQKSS